MPIYEYTCRKCNAHIEVIQKVSDKQLARHEKCGGKLEKEMSRTGFQFKGSGWYVTDYAVKKSEAKETKEAAPPVTGETSAKGETKEKSGEKSKGEKGKTATPSPTPSEGKA